jgi:hypothetical protein
MPAYAPGLVRIGAAAGVSPGRFLRRPSDPFGRVISECHLFRAQSPNNPLAFVQAERLRQFQIAVQANFGSVGDAAFRVFAGQGEEVNSASIRGPAKQLANPPWRTSRLSQEMAKDNKTQLNRVSFDFFYAMM